ncbi:MAG: PIG-L deacetylase family protein [Carbonactinosporaceae bacterium]
MLDDTDLTRVLVVGAHPDDVDFGAAGTVARWTDAGVEVAYLILTDGDSGGFDPDVPRSEIPGIRQAEQRAAAKCVGVDNVRFLSYPDGRLESTLALRRDITREIRVVRPQRMVIHSPERNWEAVYAFHPDHLEAGEAALRAVYPDARNPFAYPELLRDEGLEAWTVPEVWLMGGPRSDHHVEVTETFDRKTAALLAHTSQTGHMDGLEDMLRGWHAARARAVGLADGQLAETFQVVATV